MATKLEKVIYTAHAHTTGGREGRSVSDDGLLDVKLAPPKELGGMGGATNPEQLFAAGYSACFMGALKHVAGMKKSFDGDGTIPEAWFEAPGFYFMNPWALSLAKRAGMIPREKDDRTSLSGSSARKANTFPRAHRRSSTSSALPVARPGTSGNTPRATASASGRDHHRDRPR